MLGFWAENGGWFVKLWVLGKIGKKKALKSAQKRSKTFENIRKHSKTFEDIRKSVRVLSKNLAFLYFNILLN